MAKPLLFQFNGNEVALQMSKIDRSKLYGYKEVEVLDDNGKNCMLATLADDGKTIVGKGGSGLGYLTADKEWVKKDQLTAVDIEGNEIVPVKASSAAPIDLTIECSVEDYLEHNIRLIYVMDFEEVNDDLVAELKSGKIFKFDYSYRGGLKADAGFLLMGNDENLYMTVGDPTNLQFVGLQQTAAVVSEDGEEEVEEVDDIMSFDMI